MTYMCSCLAVFDIGLYALPISRMIPRPLATCTQG